MRLLLAESEDESVGEPVVDNVRLVVCESENDATKVGVGVGGGVMVAVTVADKLGERLDVVVRV